MVRNHFITHDGFLFSFKKNQSRGEYTRLSYLIQSVGKRWVKEEKYCNLEKNYFPLECVMILILTNYLNLSVISAAFGFPHTLFQLVCGTTLAYLALALSPFSPLSPFIP